MPRLDRVPKWFRLSLSGMAQRTHGTGPVSRRGGKRGALYLEMVLVVFRPSLAFGTALGLLEWKKQRSTRAPQPPQATRLNSAERWSNANSVATLVKGGALTMVAFLSGVVVGLIIGALVGFTIAVLAMVPGGAFEHTGHIGPRDSGGTTSVHRMFPCGQKVETRHRAE